MNKKRFLAMLMAGAMTLILQKEKSLLKMK